MPTHVFVDESKARHLVLAATVGALVASLDAFDVRRLVLEVDEVFRDADTAVLTAATRRRRARDDFTFDLVPPAAEPVLWVSDAVAWCQARGGHWRRRAAPLIVAR